MQNGYIATTMASIARGAGTSPAGVYVYFSSKTDIAFAVFDPWMRERMIQLERRVAEQAGPDAQLEALVEGLLRGIAADRTGQTLTLVQALATARPTDDYSPDLLHWTERQLGLMLSRILPQAQDRLLKTTRRMLMLAFDGIALRQNLRQSDLAEIGEVHALLRTIMRRAA